MGRPGRVWGHPLGDGIGEFGELVRRNGMRNCGGQNGRRIMAVKKKKEKEKH